MPLAILDQRDAKEMNEWQTKNSKVKKKNQKVKNKNQIGKIKN